MDKNAYDKFTPTKLLQDESTLCNDIEERSKRYDHHIVSVNAIRTSTPIRGLNELNSPGCLTSRNSKYDTAGSS